MLVKVKHHLLCTIPQLFGLELVESNCSQNKSTVIKRFSNHVPVILLEVNLVLSEESLLLVETWLLFVI